MTLTPCALPEHRDACLILLCDAQSLSVHCHARVSECHVYRTEHDATFHASRSLPPPTLVPHSVIDLTEAQFSHL